ncbi:type VI secretion system baseplate subunit TssG [Enterovibrio coralii]|uniref:Type VI secretion protein VasB-1 n=1 Tax=Enterovibrio coralii TaxID=294935 RepID=A0A135IDF9_9GAMM|nr:type VI secretion system baseplate subunit TssG [Enterovibrio coralii]KXF83492.1 type VI secretion protein VasB-1 [Enterovibrio coralii]
MQKSALINWVEHPYLASLQRSWQLIKHHAQAQNARPNIRFKAAKLPAHYPSAVVNVTHSYGHEWEVTTSLEALSGAKGVMPRGMYKEAMQAVFHEENHALLDFFDSFNNRYYRLLCQSEIKHDIPAQREEETFSWSQYRPSITRLLSNLHGAIARESTIPDSHFVQYTGLVGLKISCPETLRLILEDYFGYPFDVERSGLTYQPITADALTRIGGSGRNRCLGFDALVGKTAVMAGQKLDVKIKPDSYQAYQAIRSDKRLIRSINEMVKQYIGVNLKFRLLMKVNGQYLPKLNLAETKEKGQQLGQSAWITTHDNKQTFVEMPLNG